jgi:hypothetical protein
MITANGDGPLGFFSKLFQTVRDKADKEAEACPLFSKKIT